jgi:DNA-binding GntR family transcriptional regulator
VNEHQAIIDAIISKDPLAAELVMRRHVAASSQSAVLAALNEAGDTGLDGEPRGIYTGKSKENP